MGGRYKRSFMEVLSPRIQGVGGQGPSNLCTLQMNFYQISSKIFRPRK